MKIQETAIAVVITAAGVFVAGLVMNALRDNDTIKKAINGFDA